MNALTRLARVIAPLVAKAAEGQFRPGPYMLPITGGWLPDGAPINWWQTGMNPQAIVGSSAMVEACVSAYSQTVAMLPGDQWRGNKKGGRDRVDNTAASRILRAPNDYQSISDFMLNATRHLYLEGNAYALALRNSRFEVDTLHLMDSRLSYPQVAVTGDVFYRLGGNDVIASRLGGEELIVPQRDVLHIRLHSIDRRRPYPLIGESPLLAALASIAASDAITKQQINFFQNQARPSAVLSTDQILDKDQVQFLRDRWNEQAKGLDGCGPGGVPILTAGLKVVPWAVPSKDAQIAEVMKMSDENIALAYRIPLQVLGVATQHSTYASTELMMQAWIASGLGFALEHIEQGFDRLFQLDGQPYDYIEFDTSALLRSAYKDRIEALVRGVQGGVYSPNEARNIEGFDNVKFGDEPRLQAQMVPLSAAQMPPAVQSIPGAAPAPAAAGEKPAGTKPTATPTPPAGTDQLAPPAKDYDEHVQRLSRSLSAAAKRHARLRPNL